MPTPRRRPAAALPLRGCRCSPELLSGLLGVRGALSLGVDPRRPHLLQLCPKPVPVLFEPCDALGHGLTGLHELQALGVSLG